MIDAYIPSARDATVAYFGLTSAEEDALNRWNDTAAYEGYDDAIIVSITRADKR